MGIRTTLCHKHSAIFECCIEPGEAGIKGAEGKEKKKKGNEGGGVHHI
jgi:hypothetical protein